METLAPAEPEVRAFEADASRVDGREVVLTETYFYAESGGQPADRGTIDGVEVVDVQKRDGDVVHTLAEDPPFDAGEAVRGAVDDDFRTYCMRAHTASHALYGAGRRLLENLGYGGFNIDERKVRVDFTTSTEIDDDVLLELERLTNRAIWDSRGVSWEQVPVEEATAREDVAFNTKTEEGVMADADTVRVVTIDGWDAAACGGTHVANTREIGPVTVLDRSNPGEGLTRVEFAVGPTGIDRFAEIHGTALESARELGTGVDDLAETVASLREERDDLAARLDDLKTEVLGSRIAGFETVERDGVTWKLGTTDEFGPNEVGEEAKSRVGEEADVIAVVGGGDNPFVVVASTGDVDAGDVVARVTDEFGGGGGGGPTFAQGGGLPADAEEVLAYLRS
jgi:alanyl-tRNA synthetase